MKVRDLTGQRFGRLYVIKRVENKGSRSAFLCKCDCGNEKIVIGHNLLIGSTISCGCYRRERNLSFDDLTGQRFGRLTVIERTKDVGKGAYYKCKCDCGKETIVDHTRLINMNTMSCGCLKKDLSSTADGDWGTRLNRIWASMKSRCNYGKNVEYPRYGGRGIKVCEEWNEYIAFKKWALSNGYDEHLTIDRIDNDGDYCPANCRWVDKYVQANNACRNHLITICGETHTMAEWSRIKHFKRGIIPQRLRLGWTEYDAVMTPVKKR